MKSYSRLASVEERRNVKSAWMFVTLTVIALGLLFFLGIPLLGRFTAFVSDLGKSNKSIAGGDKTPPAPPRFNNFPENTNDTRVTISGNSEAGVTVKVAFNGKEQESLTDKDGNFSFDFALNSDNNVFSAIATDASGNMSQRTKEYRINYDDKNPDLTIESPSDGSSFFGSKQRQVSISGMTEVGASITINDRLVLVEESGKFQFTTSLNDGSNTFNVKSVDLAGNTTDKSITLNFSQ